jgi:TRAP-type uncharacterized transport system substrate-binding protein
MNKRDMLGYVALVLSILTVIGLFWYNMFVPYSFRLATPPAEAEITRAVEALASAMTREKAHARLNIVHFESLGETLQALQSKRADLSLARTDQPLPSASLAVAQIHEFVVVLLADPDSKITRFSDLRGRKLAELTRSPRGSGVLQGMLAVNFMDEKSIEITKVEGLSEIGELTGEKKVDALLIALPRSSRNLSLAVHAFRQAIGKTPMVIPILEAPALALRNPAFAAGEIAPGELASEISLPPAAVKTATFPMLLLADRRLSSASIQELTKQIFNTRQSIIANYPAAGRISALPTKRGSAFALHPGAITFYDAAETTFLSRYSDVIWLLLFGFSTIISLGIWFLRMLFPHQREILRNEHGELIQLVKDVRAARRVEEIDKIERRVDEIAAHLSTLVFNGKINTEQQPAFDMLMDRISHIASERREELEPKPERV